MKLIKIQRTDKYVRFRQEVQGELMKANDPKNPGTSITHQGTEERDITCHEVPLKAFDDALQDLAAVACKALELPSDYSGGMTVTTLILTYTKMGTRSASIAFRKHINATETSHIMDTPVFQIDDGSKEEGRRQCTAGHAEKVCEMIKQAERYAAGKRQQKLLDFDAKSDDDDEGGGTEPLPFEGEEGSKK